MSYLSDAEYSEFLNERICALDDATVREHIGERFDNWRQRYHAHRLIERAIELLASEKQRPSMLHLRCKADLELLNMLAPHYQFDARLFRGFLADDGLWGSLKPEWFSPFPVHRVSDWRDSENTVVFSLSADQPLRPDRDDRGNDYRDRFIDMSRFAVLGDVRHGSGDRPVVLYIDYRKVKSLEALAESVSDRYTTVGLICDPKIKNSGYHHVIREPHFYLWPLWCKHLNPDICHVNVGWGTQGIPFVPFVPDARRALVDFYDVLSFMPDEHLDVYHPEPRPLTRASENYLHTNCRHFIHRCADSISRDLVKRYPENDVTSVIEYVKDPVYSHTRPRTDDIKLVYGGIIVQNAEETDSVYRDRFFSMANFFARDNLHLYIYQSPYLYGFGRSKAVEELARKHNLTNIHARDALEEDDWVREISEYDFGIFIFSDTRPSLYPYIFSFKFATYLRAGLPVIVPEDQTLMADLVRKYGIGVVYHYEDADRMPEILAAQDIDALKKNVARFRSELGIDKGGAKVVAMYERVLSEASQEDVPVAVATEASHRVLPTHTDKASSSHSVLSLNGRTFLSEREYSRYLETRIEQAGPTLDREYVRRKVQEWASCYHIERMRQRAKELLHEFQGQPYALYLNGVASLQVAAQLLNGAAPDGLPGFQGFVIEDEFLATQDRRVFGSHPVVPCSQAPKTGYTIFSVSGHVPAGRRGVWLANDYRETFIDLRRFDRIKDTIRNLGGEATVLYPLYREIHTVPMVAKFIRETDDGLRTASLSPKPLMHADFDVALVEPCFYLWPLLFQVLDPELVHLNVGWGIQALPLSPFLPDPERTVVDFYEVLSFLPDGFFERTHSAAAEVRSAERHFCTEYDYVMHMCADEISSRLAEKYEHHGSIVSVTEYLQEPVYSVPPRDDNEIRLVYGGCMLATTSPEDHYYRAFMKVVPHYTRENLRLYIYNSPYVHGMVENNGLKEVIRKLGLSNVHACAPRKMDDFVRAISEYDYGITLLRAKDMNAAEYTYFMATKILAYLRAGLPVVIDADNRFMASLVRRYNIGVVLEDHDLENLPDILRNADLPTLKENVAKFRHEFSISRGGAKVLSMYNEMLGRSEQKNSLPAAASVPAEVHRGAEFEKLIESMANAENRLYYRDQSAQTMSSLARYARELDPSVIVELGTLAGLSLRTWVTSTEQAKIYAVDLSFRKLRETTSLLPVDLSRVTLLEQDILKINFASLWTPQDKVIFFVDAHDLPNVPIMEHVLTTALPALPQGSLVIVDDLWFSEERLTKQNARAFLENRLVGEVDELQCFDGHYAPYHAGGSFMGFAEVIPLLRFVNRKRIELVHAPGGKHVCFVWKEEYLSAHVNQTGGGLTAPTGEYGCALYNPLESVPTAPSLAGEMRRIVTAYRQGRIREVFESLSDLLRQHPHDQGLSYGVAVCLARSGMLLEARDLLEKNRKDVNHPCFQRLLDDLVERVGPAVAPKPVEPQRRCQEGGMTIFAMPKPFEGHLAIIQRNAIRSWTRLTPAPEIILIGDEAGTREMAEEVGARHIPDIRRNEFGTPLVDYVFQTAQDHASHSIMAYVNADMILFQSFVVGVQKVQAALSRFLLIGQRWDLPILDEIDFDRPQWRELLQRQMEEHAMLHAECGLDYFVFPKGLYPKIPPFAIGRTAWDNWLVMTPHKLGVPVVDGTEYITAVHQDHDYGHVAGRRDGTWNGVEAQRNRALAGMTDNSGRSSGATRALRADGTLAAVGPRQPWYMTATYRVQRSAWLLKQADRLMAVGRKGLATGKWEEAVVLQEVLLASGWPGDAPSESMTGAELAKCYATTCLKLARCYAEMGHQEQAAATYARLLANPCIQIPPARRDELAQARDHLTRTVRQRQQSGNSPAVPQRQNAGTQAAPAQVDPRATQKFEPVKAAAPLARPVCDGAEVDGQRMEVLNGLERDYRSMPEAAPAKHAVAVRLAELFRRAGLADKSRSYEREATALKSARDSQEASRSEDGRKVARTPAPREPKITVITACRNAEQYLAQCLDSVLNQTLRDWELFLLDDGSTDGTRQVIADYAGRDARIRPFYFNEQVGPYVRRNFAIERAGTPFIVIQDADDIMCPEKLQRLHEAMAQDDALAVVGSFYKKFLDAFRGTEYTEDVALVTGHDQILELYRTQQVWDYSWHGSAIIRRSLFHEVGLYDENPFGADSFWLAKVAEYACHTGKIRLGNICEFLTLRRVHSASQTGMLPPLDPRGRRAHYWQYCLGRLRQVAEEAARRPGLDVARELRECNCSDFLERFKAEILAWENAPLDDRVVPHFLDDAMLKFKKGQYIGCVRTLRGIETMEPAAPRHVANFDLFEAMALYALGHKEQSLIHLRRETTNHDSPAARQFRADYFERDPEADVGQWYTTYADRFGLRMVYVQSKNPTPPSAVGHRPKVTVITACRNAEPFLSECLDSILKQTLAEWELFLLDDGSTDGTRRIIEEYTQRDARIKAHCFDDHTGPYVRRNFAIKRASSEFIVIQDADDIMCPTKLEILYNEISSDDSLAMVGSNYRTFLEAYRGPEYTEYNGLPLAHEEILDRFRSWRHGMSHGSAIIRKTLFAEIGYYDENPFAADTFWSGKLALYIDAGKALRVKNVPECLTLLRMHTGNHTRLLSTLDPRNRRMRYRQYCECKLNQIRDRLKSAPQAEIIRGLRECRCSDFLTRFKAQIIAWESEPLDEHIIPEFLQSAVKLFNQAYYVSCANILNGVETIEPTIAKQVVGYELLRGMTLFAVEMRERSRMHLDREVQQHDNPAARQFIQDAFEPPADLDVQQWCEKNAGRLGLGLAVADVEDAAKVQPIPGRERKQQAGV